MKRHCATDPDYLVEIAEAFLAEREWDFERSVREDAAVSFSGGVHSFGQNYKVFVEATPRNQWLEVFIYSGFCVASGAFTETAVLVNHINTHLGNGRLAVLAEGEPIQFKQVFDAEGVTATPKVIGNMIDCGLSTFRDYTAKLAAVALTGAKAADITASHEQLPTRSPVESPPALSQTVP